MTDQERARHARRELHALSHLSRLATAAASDAVVSAQATQQQYLAHYHAMVAQFGATVGGATSPSASSGSGGIASGIERDARGHKRGCEHGRDREREMANPKP